MDVIFFKDFQPQEDHVVYYKLSKYALMMALMGALVAAAGCSDDSDADAINCTSDELYDQVIKTCVPRFGRDIEQQPEDAGTSDAQDTGADADATGDDVQDQDITQGDAQQDDVEDDAINWAECDKDNDGELSEACGGFDCDDNDPQRSSLLEERCDHIDNNCSGTNNEFLDCTFYANSRNELYKIDPFAMTATFVTDAPGMQDIDTHRDGTLFGIKHDGIYHYDDWSDEWVHHGGYGRDIGDSNGLAIDREGTAYITSDDKIYSADLRSGRASFVGYTGNFKSSGDCVVDKGNTLYMTSKAPGQSDTLVKVSRADGSGEMVGAPGAIGFEKVYSLTAAWGTLYGLTTNGELIEINSRTGVGRLVHTFEGKSFWGAASTPNR